MLWWRIKNLERRDAVADLILPPGGVFKEERVAKMTANRRKWTTCLLKDALAIFRLKTDGARVDLIKRLTDYLFDPSITKGNISTQHIY